jgi:hypothetical protein
MPTSWRNRHRHGIGTALLKRIRRQSTRPMLIGTWEAAGWAIRFYQSTGFNWCRPRSRLHRSRPIGASLIGTSGHLLCSRTGFWMRHEAAFARSAALAPTNQNKSQQRDENQRQRQESSIAFDREHEICMCVGQSLDHLETRPPCVLSQLPVEVRKQAASGPMTHKLKVRRKCNPSHGVRRAASIVAFPDWPQKLALSFALELVIARSVGFDRSDPRGGGWSGRSRRRF